MNLQEILNEKGSAVHTINVSASLGDVVATLVERNCGSLIVMDGEEVAGIITERDVLRACAQVDQPLADVPVSARMTRDLVTAPPDATINDVMGLLTERRIRHLPVVDEERGLVGLVSIGDVVKTQHNQLTMENHYLKEYLQG